jgi:membrane dipeptidase
MGAVGDVPRRATELGISRDALALYGSSDVIDLHVDSFIWTRVFGYDLLRRHGPGIFGGRIFGQVDFPRIREAGVTGATWAITTNPLRSSAGRSRAFFRNLSRLKALLDSAGDFRLVKTAAEYRAARNAGLHGALLGVQGGNALDRDLDEWKRAGDEGVTRVTLVHLSSSSFGTTSTPIATGPLGLTALGQELVRRLDAERIFVDLAHVSRAGFFDAAEAHDKTLPLIVTHTGVSGVTPHWRNLDDEQLRAIASTGGTVGVVYHSHYLGQPFWGGRAAAIVDHLEHIVRVVGEDHASLGSDWDGAIFPPRDVPTCLELPRLVQIMLDRKWSDLRIRKVLGGNFLRALEMLRG